MGFQRRVVRSQLIPAPAEEVWTAIREFDSIDEWHPNIDNASMEEGRSATEIGGVRCFDAGERTVREQLVAHSDVDRLYQYTMLQGAGVKEDYLSRLKVIPITESNDSVVEWSSDFDAPASKMEDEIARLGDIYTAGIDALQVRFS